MGQTEGGKIYQKKVDMENEKRIDLQGLGRRGARKQEAVNSKQSSRLLIAETGEKTLCHE